MSNNAVLSFLNDLVLKQTNIDETKKAGLNLLIELSKSSGVSSAGNNSIMIDGLPLSLEKLMEAVRASFNGNYIQSIKIIREATGCGLVPAKNFADKYIPRRIDLTGVSVFNGNGLETKYHSVNAQWYRCVEKLAKANREAAIEEIMQTLFVSRFEADKFVQEHFKVFPPYSPSHRPRRSSRAQFKEDNNPGR